MAKEETLFHLFKFFGHKECVADTHLQEKNFNLVFANLSIYGFIFVHQQKFMQFKIKQLLLFADRVRIFTHCILVEALAHMSVPNSDMPWALYMNNFDK